ncbi:MAG TPA: methylated-DNA--[protein]-cysteine S-methyltransferase [Solirubrobacterales bacterium]|nr:methylated-DNA--[protein]-cysteine S-methyltransferase [Solirubrobacterales bacterium]
MDAYWATYESPLGPLTLLGGDQGLRGLRFPGRGGGLSEAQHRPDAFAPALEQLAEYFAGERQAFELAFEIGGSQFQRQVWEQLREIPYGTTVSYKELAQRLGRPGEAREVGAAVGRTPLPILIPCHRVVASNGDLTGYLGGLQRKQALLDLEASVAAGRGPAPAWAFRQLTLS